MNFGLIKRSEMSRVSCKNKSRGDEDSTSITRDITDVRSLTIGNTGSWTHGQLDLPAAISTGSWTDGQLDGWAAGRIGRWTHLNLDTPAAGRIVESVGF